MKKLRVILPAILTLAVSTSAAVTGTVAWFTATRLQTITMNNLTAVNPEAGLNVTLTAVAGVTVAGNTVTHKNMRDASVALANNAATVYRAKLNSQGTAPAGYEVVASTYQTPITDLYYATAYDAKFSLAITTTSNKYELFLDYKNCSFTDVATKNDISPAFRIGYYTGTKFVVMAPFAEEATAITYVDSTSTANGSYSSALKKVSEYTDPIAGLDQITNTTAAAELTHIGTLEGETQLTIHVFTWFEGTDEACVNASVDGEKKANAITSSLQFRMLEQKAA